ncbi:MAG: DUF4252 domain-containing protein [Flavobacteriaceae bacterium]|nr:DUF4252 domain-containing protein [Flavobacteriaceae bacterium]
MRVLITKSALFILVVSILTACNSEPTLQEYLVAKRDAQQFINVDLPVSLFQFDSISLDENQKAALKSIKKINVLALQVQKSGEAMYAQEKETITKILQGDKFNELMRFKTGSQQGVLTYYGEETAIDEMIFFGTDNNRGLIILRLLGDNMQPAQMTQLAQSFQGMDNNTAGLSVLEDLFK